MIIFFTLFWICYFSVLTSALNDNVTAGRTPDRSCKAEPVVMNIRNPDVYGSKFEPMKYTVYRCWGDCRSKTICKPYNIRRFNITVIEYKLNDDNTKGRILGRTTERAEHHDCGCVINNMGLEEKKQCERKWCHGHVYDEVNYQCICREVFKCPEGTIFHEKSCKCHPTDEKGENIQLTICPDKTEISIPSSSTTVATEVDPADYVALYNCVPLPAVVLLTSYIRDMSPDVKYEPSELVLNRCGGSCKNKQLRNYCRIDKTTNKTVTVKAFQYSYEEDNYKFAKNVEVNVTEHSECSCGCTNSPEKNICSQVQKHNPKNCGCDCTNLDVKDLCVNDPEWSKNHKWNEETCDCICTDPNTCPIT